MRNTDNAFTGDINETFEHFNKSSEVKAIKQLLLLADEFAQNISSVTMTKVNTHT